MNAERRTPNAGTKTLALRPTLRVARSTFHVSYPAPAVHRSSFIVHRFVVLLSLLLVAPTDAAAGGAWEAQRSGTMAWLRAVYFVDEREGWAVGSKGALLRTTNGGQSWEVRRRPTEDSLRDVYFLNGQAGWLVCDRSIYLLKTREEPRSYLMKTTDGGANWSRVGVTGADVDVLLTRVAFVDDLRGWAFGEMGALYATADGGASWSRQVLPTKHLLLGGAFLDAGQGWLVGAGNTILYNPDGEGWRAGNSPIGTATRFNAVSFVDGRRGWAVGERGLVLLTTNGGREWFRQESGVRVDLSDVKFLDARTGWAVGAEGTIIHTADGGANWQVEPSGTRHPLERLSVASRGRAWAVGFGGTIVRYADDAQAAPAPSLKIPGREQKLKTPDAEQPKGRPRRVNRNSAAAAARPS